MGVLRPELLSASLFPLWHTAGRSWHCRSSVGSVPDPAACGLSGQAALVVVGPRSLASGGGDPVGAFGEPAPRDPLVPAGVPGVEPAGACGTIRKPRLVRTDNASADRFCPLFCPPHTILRGPRAAGLHAGRGPPQGLPGPRQHRRGLPLLQQRADAARPGGRQRRHHQPGRLCADQLPRRRPHHSHHLHPGGRRSPGSPCGRRRSPLRPQRAEAGADRGERESAAALCRPGRLGQNAGRGRRAGDGQPPDAVVVHDPGHRLQHQARLHGLHRDRDAGHGAGRGREDGHVHPLDTARRPDPARQLGRAAGEPRRRSGRHQRIGRRRRRLRHPVQPRPAGLPGRHALRPGASRLAGPERHARGQDGADDRSAGLLRHPGLARRTRGRAAGRHPARARRRPGQRPLLRAGPPVLSARRPAARRPLGPPQLPAGRAAA